MLNKCKECEFYNGLETSIKWTYGFTSQVVDCEHSSEILVFPEYVKWTSNFGLFLTLFRSAIHQKSLPILFLSQCTSWIKHNKRTRDIKYCIKDRQHLDLSNKVVYFFSAKAGEIFNIPKPVRFYKAYQIEECFLGTNITVYVFPSYYKFIADLNTNIDFVKNALILSSGDDKINYKEATQSDIDELEKEDKLVIDIESNHMLNQFDDEFRITHLGISSFKNDTVYLIKDADLIKNFNIENKTIIGFNTSWDIIAFLCFVNKKHLIDTIFIEDVMLLAYLLNENREFSTGNNLKGLALAEFGLTNYYEPLHDIEMLSSEINKLSKKIEQVKTEATKEKYTQKLNNCTKEYLAKQALLDEYNAKDVYYTKKLYEKYSYLIEEQYDKTFMSYINKAMRFLARIRIQGIYINYNKTQQMYNTMKNDLQKIKEDIQKIAPINPMSNLEVSNWILTNYSKEHIHFTKTTNGQISISSEQLQSYLKRDEIKQHKDLMEIFKLIDIYRNNDKKKSFLKIILDKSIDSILRGQYSLTRTVTGRIASSNPNMQQFPKDVFNKVIESRFGKEGTILEFDYRQAEFRMFAMLANETVVKDILEQGTNVDLYKEIASRSLNKDISKVTPQERENYKVVSLATIYGITPFGLAKQLNISREEAQNIQESFFETFPMFLAYIDRVSEDVFINKFVLSVTGRYRRFPELFNRNYKLSKGAKHKIMREAVNFEAQGSSSDITLYNAAYVQSELTKNSLKSTVINLIHDSIIIDTFLDEKEKVLNIFKEVGLQIPSFIKRKLPLVVPLEYEVKEIQDNNN